MWGKAARSLYLDNAAVRAQPIDARAALDPTYLAREAMQTPWFRAQAERQATQWRERMQPPTVEGWSGENWGSMPNPQYDPSFDAPFAAVQRFLAAPRAEPAAAPEPEMPAPTATQVPVPSAATGSSCCPGG